MVRAARNHEGSFEPSRAEIKAQCAEFQRTWGDRERARRAGNSESHHWTPPVVSIREFIVEDDSLRHTV